MKSLIACSLFAIATVAAVPAMAQGIYVGPNGVGVDAGEDESVGLEALQLFIECGAEKGAVALLDEDEVGGVHAAHLRMRLIAYGCALLVAVCGFIASRTAARYNGNTILTFIDGHSDTFPGNAIVDPGSGKAYFVPYPGAFPSGAATVYWEMLPTVSPN